MLTDPILVFFFLLQNYLKACIHSLFSFIQIFTYLPKHFWGRNHLFQIIDEDAEIHKFDIVNEVTESKNDHLSLA